MYLRTYVICKNSYSQKKNSYRMGWVGVPFLLNGVGNKDYYMY